ncbi:MAG: hypothetical protein KAS90_05005 [Candidatus Aenigmarchaeota archaeon]|nr:hypothetical protein [Candidatus Aenigmarchaeota archaeon]
MFDLSELNSLDVDYMRSLQNLKEHLCSDYEMGGISLSQSLKKSLVSLEALESGAGIQTDYRIEPELKKKMNREKIKKLTGLFNVFKNTKPDFDSQISRVFVYEAALQNHLDNFNEARYGEDNKKQFEMELEKTGFLVHSASLLYISSFGLVENLLRINNELSGLGLWVAGSDFIESIDISFACDDGLVFGNDFLKNEFLFRSYLKESSDDAAMRYIENGDIGAIDEVSAEKRIMIIDKIHKKYSFN